jgi:hypothetical protein
MGFGLERSTARFTTITVSAAVAQESRTRSRGEQWAFEAEALEVCRQRFDVGRGAA